MKTTLTFKSVGKTHQEEVKFFKFLVQSLFNDSGSKVIQWCTFNGLSITIEAVTPQVVLWGIETIGNIIETPTGYKFIKITT